MRKSTGFVLVCCRCNDTGRVESLFVTGAGIDNHPSGRYCKRLLPIVCKKNVAQCNSEIEPSGVVG
jgi:hypothetical protein